MAALQCEICGGKLMAKAGGLFECEYCGMQYDKTRIQEMVQEIKGTVKVEGTVAVTGTVAVDHKTNIDNLLKRIAICAKDSNFQKVPVLIEELLKLDPECGAAYLWQVAAKFDCCSLEDIFEQHLDTLTSAFLDLDVNLNSVTDVNGRHFLQLGFRQFLNEIHG
mgnify:CR=1 FL=1